MSQINQNNAVFCGIILLKNSVCDLNAVINRLQSEWNLELDLSSPEEKNCSSSSVEKYFYIKDYKVSLELINQPVPGGEAEFYAQGAYFWPEAVDTVKQHTAQLVVSVVPPDGGSLLFGGQLYAMLVASCLCQPEALGVYTNGTVFPPHIYLRVVEDMKGPEPELPVLVWVYLGLYQDENGNNAYTNGMKNFGKDEMEILGSKASLEDIHGALFDFAYYVINNDVTLQDGETIGFTQEQKLPITRSPGVQVDGMSLKIGF